MLKGRTPTETTYRTRNKKYGNKKTVFNDRKFDSKFEAGVARDLELRKKAGEILDYECQYKVEMWAYTKDGQPAMKKTHKVDFRAHNPDGSFTLIEAKGFETQDYKDRRQWLTSLWLPEHPDHEYEVIYNR